jgi:hypothetical protein
MSSTVNSKSNLILSTLPSSFCLYHVSLQSRLHNQSHCQLISSSHAFGLNGQLLGVVLLLFVYLCLFSCRIKDGIVSVFYC